MAPQPCWWVDGLASLNNNLHIRKLSGGLQAFDGMASSGRRERIKGQGHFAYTQNSGHRRVPSGWHNPTIYM
jgi:hypothetical protein